MTAATTRASTVLVAEWEAARPHCCRWQEVRRLWVTPPLQLSSRAVPWKLTVWRPRARKAGVLSGA